jgi:hypothetical protein
MVEKLLVSNTKILPLVGSSSSGNAYAVPTTTSDFKGFVEFTSAQFSRLQLIRDKTISYGSR